MKKKILFQIVVLLALLVGFLPEMDAASAVTSVPYNRDAAVNWAVSDNRNNGGYYGKSEGRYCVTYVTKALQVGGLPGISVMDGLGSFVPWLQNHTDYWEYRPLEQLEKGDFILLAAKRLNDDPSPLVAWDLQHILLVTGTNLASAWNAERLNLSFSSWTGSYAQSIGIHIRTSSGSSPVTYDREQVYWDASYSGQVNELRHERWPVYFNTTRTFTITAVATSGNLVPRIILQNSAGSEVAGGTGSLSSTQPAGNYSILIQPQSGSGDYTLKIVQGGSLTIENGVSTISITSEEVILQVCGDNLNGKTVYVQMWRGPVDGNPDRTFNTQATASGTCITFTDLEGSGPVFQDVTYFTVASIEPIADGEAKKQRTACYTDTGGLQLCDSIRYSTDGTENDPPAGTFASASLSAASIEPGGSSLVTISLNNLPAGGFSSAEFTCTAIGLEIGSISEAGLFGSDAPFIPGAPQNGTFIAAIAGSNGNRASSNGPALTFTATGTQAGQYSVGCTVRVSSDGNSLEEIASQFASLTVQSTITPTPPTPTPPTPTPPPPAETPTPPAPTPETLGALNGSVLAGKPVTLTAEGQIPGSLQTISTNPDGSFSVALVAGTYTVTATAEGCLGAHASVTILAGQTTTLPLLALLAGDVNGDGQIDPLDVVTIGANYGSSSPSQADLNGDGTINVLDLSRLADNFRKAGPIEW